MEFTKDPSTHPANGPLTEERLIRVREWLQSSLAYSEGSNWDYMMADAAKAIDELLAVRKVGKEPVAWRWRWSDDAEGCWRYTEESRQTRGSVTAQPLYAAPQLPQPAVPDESAIFDAAIDICRKSEAIDEHAWNRGVLAVMSAFKACRAAMLQGAEPVSQPYTLRDGYCIMPMKLTAENGAKCALSGEFSETKFINCPECFGDDECETCDGSGRIEISVPVSWTTIKQIWAKGVEHFAAAPQQEAE